MNNTLAVVIIKAQPLHRGHIYNIQTGLEIADKVLVLVGSAFNSENTWSYSESENMILTTYSNTDRVYIEPLADFLYQENQWLTEVQDIVRSYVSTKVILVGNADYLRSFPQWDIYDTGNWAIEVEKPQPFIKKPTVLVHAVILQSGHILLVEKGELLALPGGALGTTEDVLQEAMLKELREELKLKVPVPVLKGSIKKSEIFSKRNITAAYYIQLKDNEELPKAKGATWVPLAEFYEMSTQMYSDHFHIVKRMIDNE